MPDDDKPPPPGPKPAPTSITHAQLRAYLARPEALQRARRLLGLKIAAQDVEDFLNRAVVEAMAATALPETEAKAPAWFDGVCTNLVAGHYRKDKRRAKYHGPMPSAPSSGEDGADAGPRGDGDVSPSDHDEDAEDSRLDGALLRAWLGRDARHNPRDAETLAWMLQMLDDDRTPQQIADANRVSVESVKKRVHDFRKKYLPRYQRWRDRTLPLLLLLGAFVLVGGALLLWWWLHAQAVPPVPPMVPVHPPAVTVAPQPVVPWDRWPSHPAPSR